MKVLFGGTFDPVHSGHIKLALHVNQLLAQPVSWLPLAGTPNYKPLPVATLSHRLAMLELTLTKYPAQLTIDYSEAILNYYSPTVETLTRLRQHLPPDMPLFFIIGGDSLLTLNSWDNYQQLFKLTNLIVAMRPGYPLQQMPTSLSQQIWPRIVPKVDCQQAAGQIIITDFEPLPISSTAIRQVLQHGEPPPAGWLLPEVIEYIHNHNLYKEF